MTIRTNFIEEVEYLLVEVSGGEWEARDGVDAILTISKRAKEKGFKRILVDRRNLADPKNEYARFEAGCTIAKEFPHPFKFAVVHHHGKLSKFGEDIAVNRRARAMNFSDMDEAKQWLIKGPPA